jgi:hypothetical protein
MIWLLVGLMIGGTVGGLVLTAVSIHRTRDTQAVVDAVGVYLTQPLDENWGRLRDAYSRLVAGQEREMIGVGSYPRTPRQRSQRGSASPLSVSVPSLPVVDPQP